MLEEKKPTVAMLKNSGHFVGYFINFGGLYETFVFYKKHWAIIDGWDRKTNKYWSYVEEYKGKLSDLAVSFHPVDGCPQYK